MAIKWQEINKYVGGGSVGLFVILALIFNLAGMTYTHDGDKICVTDCYSEIRVNSTYWNIKVEHAGDKDIIFKKQTRSRTLWLNLDKIDEFIKTDPDIQTALLVGTTKKYSTIKHEEYGYLRPIKDGDYLIKRVTKSNPYSSRIIIYGNKSVDKTVKWSFILEDAMMEDIDIDPIWYGRESNKLNYTNNDLTVNIKDALNSDIGKGKLTSHVSVDEQKRVIYGFNRTVMSYLFTNFSKTIKNGLGDVIITNMKTGEIENKSYHFEYSVYENFTLPYLVTVCEKINESYFANGTFKNRIYDNCSTSQIGNYIKPQLVKKGIYNSRDIPDYDVEISLVTDVWGNDSYDAKWKLVGKYASLHAVWNSSFNDGLIGVYEMNETTGSNVPEAINGTINGTATNMENGDWVSCLCGNCLDFDGGNEYVNVPDNNAWNFTNNFSLEAWVNLNVITSTQHIIAKDESGKRSFKLWWLANDGIYWDVFVSTVETRVLNSTTGINPGNWTYLVATYEFVTSGSSIMKIYINGTLSGTNSGAAGPIDLFNGELDIGRRAFGGAETPVNGRIDNVMIYNRILEQGEITDKYNEGNCLSYDANPILPDDEYPLFTNMDSTANNTSYVFNANYTFNVTITNVNGTAGLEFNSVNYTASNTTTTFNVSVSNLAVGDYTYYWWAYGNGTNNNYNTSAVFDYTVGKAAQAITPLLNGANSNLVITYPQQINASYSGTNSTAVTININGTSVNIGANLTWGSGGWVINYTAPTNQNYSAFEALLNLTINKQTSVGTLYLNNSVNNITLLLGNIININGTLDIGIGNIQLYVNNIIINEGASPIFNLTQFNTTGLIPVNFTYGGNQNFTNFNIVLYANVTDYISLSVDSPVELGSNITIDANLTSGFEVCIDVDHPAYGVNASCSSDSLNFNVTINYFWKKLFDNGSLSLILSPTGSLFNTTEFNVSTHQYDEVDNLSINISGTDNPYDLTFYKCNKTNFDRVFEGVLKGNNVYVSNISNTSINSTGLSWANLTFNNPGEITKYFYLDDSAKDNLINFTLNVSGFAHGILFEDNFDNFNLIDEDLTNAHLDLSGVILLANSSKIFNIYDEYDSSIGNGWVTITDSNSAVSETSSYIRSSINSGGTGDSWSSESSVATNLSVTGMSLYTSDHIEFRVIGDYLSHEDSCANDGRSKIDIGGTNIWTSNYLETDLESDEQSSSDLIIYMDKINKTSWVVNITGWETSSSGSYVCDDGSATFIRNWTNGNYTLDSGTGGCDISEIFTTVFNVSLNYTYIDTNTPAIKGISTGSTSSGCSLTHVKTDIYAINRTLWFRDNASIISKSIYDSSGVIEKATGSFQGISISPDVFTYFLSANNGNNWENITPGVEHTFTNTGNFLKWRVDINSTFNGYINRTSYLSSVNVTTPHGSPSNISFDFGDDDIIDYTISGDFNQTNGTIQIDLTNSNISEAFNNSRAIYDHLYEIPLVISSDSVGIVKIFNINLSYNPNPVILNKTEIQNCVSNLTSYGNLTTVIGSRGGNITLDDLRFYYAGGNNTIEFKAHNTDYTINTSLNITYFYSRWEYDMPVDWLQFLPGTATSKNVTPYGQSLNVPILNITNLGYGGKNVNLSLYVNDSESCVNLTLSLTNNKSDGFFVNESWVQLNSSIPYLNQTKMWLWADYECNYSNWRMFEPYLYFRQCCEGCVCSEDLI